MFAVFQCAPWRRHLASSISMQQQSGYTKSHQFDRYHGTTVQTALTLLATTLPDLRDETSVDRLHRPSTGAAVAFDEVETDE